MANLLDYLNAEDARKRQAFRDGVLDNGDQFMTDMAYNYAQKRGKPFAGPMMPVGEAPNVPAEQPALMGFMNVGDEADIAANPMTARARGAVVPIRNTLGPKMAQDTASSLANVINVLKARNAQPNAQSTGNIGQMAGVGGAGDMERRPEFAQATGVGGQVAGPMGLDWGKRSAALANGAGGGGAPAPVINRKFKPTDDAGIEVMHPEIAKEMQDKIAASNFNPPDPAEMEAEMMKDPAYREQQINRKLRKDLEARRQGQGARAVRGGPTLGADPSMSVDDLNRNYNPAISPRQGFAQNLRSAAGVPYVTDGRLRIPTGGVAAPEVPQADPSKDTYAIDGQKMTRQKFEDESKSPGNAARVALSRLGLSPRDMPNRPPADAAKARDEAVAKINAKEAAAKEALNKLGRNAQERRETLQANRLRKFSEAQAAGPAMIEREKALALAERLNGQHPGGAKFPPDALQHKAFEDDAARWHANHPGQDMPDSVHRQLRARNGLPAVGPVEPAPNGAQQQVAGKKAEEQRQKDVKGLTTGEYELNPLHGGGPSQGKLYISTENGTAEHVAPDGRRTQFDLNNPEHAARVRKYLDDRNAGVGSDYGEGGMW